MNGGEAMKAASLGVFEVSGHALCILDREGRIMDVNPAFLCIFPEAGVAREPRAQLWTLVPFVRLSEQERVGLEAGVAQALANGTAGNDVHLSGRPGSGTVRCRFRLLSADTDGDARILLECDPIEPMGTSTGAARLGDFADVAHEWYWESDAEHRFVWFSPGFGVATGVSAARLLGRTRIERMQGHNDPDLIAAHAATLDRHEPFRDFEFRIIDRHGDNCYLRVSGKPRFDEDGRFLGYRGSCSDVTREASEVRATRRARDALARAIEVLPIPFALWNPDSALEVCNARYRELFAPLGDLLKPGVGYDDLIRAAESGGLASINAESPAHRPSGDASESGRLLELQFADGRTYAKRGHRLPDGSIADFLTDTTEVRALAQTARGQEAQYEAMFRAVEHAIVTLDAEGRIVAFNPAAERLFDYPVEDVLGQYIDALMPAALANHPEGRLKVLLDGQRRASQPKARTYEGRKRDGTVFPFELSFRFWRRGGRRFVTGVVRDLTHERAVERSLHEARDQAERASRAKSEFLSNMSHELRTPLNSILGFAQLLSSDPRAVLNPEQTRFVGQIEKAGQHLLYLINQILDMAKIEAGQLSLDLADIRIRDVVEETIALVRPLADKREVTLLPPVLCDVPATVCADRMRLRQVLHNLLGNAVKYNRKGGTAGIEVASGADDTVRFAVVDNGKGIPEGQIPQIFEIFGRLERDEASVEGTGIGLPLSRHLIELMGGRIGVESEKGIGSRFWLDLPAGSDVPEEARQAASASVRVSQSPTAARSRRTVLYIEDNAANLLLMEQIMRRVPSVRLLSAPTAEEGIELAEAFVPDVILLDINLPGMDGFAALAQLRGIAALRTTPVLAVSASAMPDDVERGRVAGFSDYLVKPVAVPGVLAALERAFKMERLQ